MKEIATRAVRPDQPKPPTRDCACLSVGRGGRAAKYFTNASRLRRRELRYRLGFGRGHKITWAYPITPMPILRKSLQGFRGHGRPRAHQGEFGIPNRRPFSPAISLTALIVMAW